MSSPASKNLVIGSVLGPYRLVEQLGAGGAGTVFVAENSETQQKCAVKILRPGADEIEEIHARFIREITVAQKLDDPHVVAYYDCGVEDGILYYAMEHVPWGSLSDVLKRRGTLPWRDACECAQQMALALQHLHTLGIVHRDLKPANVFLSDTGRLKIGDFGLARDSDSPKLTVQGMTVGTCKYISPEQAKGQSDLDQAADLYALGCNLFELIIGRTPFETPDSYEATTFVEMMRRHIEQPPPKLSDLAPQCPQRLSKLVDRLLAKDRKDRPESAAEVAKELQKIIEYPDVGSSAKNGDSNEEKPILTERLRSNSVTTSEISNTRLIIIGVLVLVGIVLVAFSSWGK